MESKAMFDLDQSNNPIIRLEIASTSDVRDKIAKRFTEALGHNSQWCVILPTSETEWQIWPIKPEELRVTAQYLSERADVVDSLTPPFPTPGKH